MITLYNISIYGTIALGVAHSLLTFKKYKNNDENAYWFFSAGVALIVYKRSWTGIALTIFCLFTSMIWFNKPELISEEAEAFLQFEKEWLTGTWDLKKWLLTLTIPVSFIALELAFWKRSVLMGLGVVILIATGKIIWSIQNAGEAGKSILIPAVIGLILCIGLIHYGFKKLERKSNK